MEADARMIDLVGVAGEVRARLLAWYDGNRRELPWRTGAGERLDPYRIWLSEVMLQQTRVETVRGYFTRWLDRFPTLEALAAAEGDEVMKAWEGLGYYSRARNFHQAAREVADRYRGQVPTEIEAFRALPGVGRYTAGAVMSIAFGREAPVVDGNVRRLFARWFDEPAPSDADLWARAEALVQGERPGDLNQALMELGATVCTPRSPRCGECPVERHCGARARGTTGERPAPRTSRALPHEDTGVAVVWHDEKLLLVRRPPAARLGGMWEFPGTVRRPGESVGAAVVRGAEDALDAEISVEAALGQVVHLFSHVRVTYRALRCALITEGGGGGWYDAVRWVAPEDLHRYALPSAQKKIANLATSRRNGLLDG
jgi:A/G-specific adenine glycosylase